MDRMSIPMVVVHPQFRQGTTGLPRVIRWLGIAERMDNVQGDHAGLLHSVIRTHVIQCCARWSGADVRIHCERKIGKIFGVCW